MPYDPFISHNCWHRDLFIHSVILIFAHDNHAEVNASNRHIHNLHCYFDPNAILNLSSLVLTPTLTLL